MADMRKTRNKKAARIATLRHAMGHWGWKRCERFIENAEQMDDEKFTEMCRVWLGE